MKRFFMRSVSLFGVLCLLVALLVISAPKSSFAQVFLPCDTNGCTMRGYILFSGGIPVATGTGTPVMTANSTNSAGQVTAGSSATSVVVTFANGGFPAIPFCMIGSETQLAAFAYTVSKTAITVTQTATSGNILDYRCGPST